MPSRGENTPERGREEGRSRKCLQLSLKKGSIAIKVENIQGLNSGEGRGLPLVETGNLPPSPHRTPSRGKKTVGGRQ